MLIPKGLEKGGLIRHSWEDLKRFYRYLAPYKRWAILAGVTMGISILLALPVPLLTMHLIDVVLPQGNLQRLYLICVAVFFILLVRTLASLAQQFWLSRLKVLVIARLRMQVLEHLLTLPLNYFQRHTSAYLASRLSGDCGQATQGLLADSLLNLVRQCLTFFFGVAILFTLHAGLTSVICLLLPFFILSVMRSNKLIRRHTSTSLETAAQSTGVLQRTLSSVAVVRAFGAEKRELIRNLRALKESLKSRRRTEIISAVTSLTSDFIGAAAPVILLLYGGREVVAGRLTIGELVAFSSYLGFLFGPIEGIVTLNVIAQGSLTALQRVFELLDTPGERTCGSARARSPLGEFHLRDVCFSYEPGKEVLHKLNLHIRPGEILLLSGPSGVGKTTLLLLLAGLLNQDSGRILLSGKDLKEYDRRFLRRQIGFVHQEHVLFPGTIEENIRYGRPSASGQEVAQAARLANAAGFIEALDSNYDTMVGEGGSGLSVGQKQRLCIARALLMRPSILLMDEPTASVDARSERLIQRTVAELAPNVTCILASHRHSIREVADRIIEIGNIGSTTGPAAPIGSIGIPLERAGAVNGRIA